LVGIFEILDSSLSATLSARRHIPRDNLISNLFFDFTISIFEIFDISRNDLHFRDKCCHWVDVYADDLSAKTKTFNHRNATAAEWVKDDASGIGVVLDKGPKDAPGPPGKIPVHLVNRRMGLSDYRVVDRFQVVQIL
jgi:hypothetical protein